MSTFWDSTLWLGICSCIVNGHNCNLNPYVYYCSMYFDLFASGVARNICVLILQPSTSTWIFYICTKYRMYVPIELNQVKVHFIKVNIVTLIIFRSWKLYMLKSMFCNAIKDFSSLQTFFVITYILRPTSSSLMFVFLILPSIINTIVIKRNLLPFWRQFLLLGSHYFCWSFSFVSRCSTISAD
jgi:hypothetical protein